MVLTTFDIGSKVNPELRAAASDPATSPERLQQLAGSEPSLRPLIAMNPSAYPALLDWLAELGDPAVNLALQQRRATEEARFDAPQRVSVMNRSAETRVRNAESAPEQDSENLLTAPSGSATEDRRQFRPGLIAIWVIVVAVTIGLLIAGFHGLRGGAPTSADKGDSAGNSESAGAQSQEGDGSVGTELPDENADGQSDGEAEASEAKFPAPANAFKEAHIVSPSANIACSLGAEGVTCSIYSYSFASEVLGHCQGQPTTLRSEGNLPTVSCLDAPVPSIGATTLSYGEFATFGQGACLSTDRGMSCWDTVSGNSFAVAREGFVFGAAGMIASAEFPW